MGNRRDGGVDGFGGRCPYSARAIRRDGSLLACHRRVHLRLGRVRRAMPDESRTSPLRPPPRSVLHLRDGADDRGFRTLSGDGSSRRVEEVIRAHLSYRETGELERDLAENYAEDVILLSAEGVNRGHDGVPRLAEILGSYAGRGAFIYRQVLVEEDFAMLQWSGRGDRVDIHDGADSYVVRNGLIVAQGIHYSTRPKAADQRV
jgi:hypothetical protein